MKTLLIIIIASIIVSLISLIGILSLMIKHSKLEKITKFLVALSAGSLIGGAFLHLIPEASENLDLDKVLIFVLLGFVLFFLIEKVLHWRHCHKDGCKVHSFAKMSLLGDGIHNFIDGLIIASSFLVDFKLGIITTLAIIVHEIPQEIGDFGVLIYGGYSKKRALLFNFVSALIAILGGLVGYFVFSTTNVNYGILLAVAAGGFLYISSSDLIPELRKETNLTRTFINFLIFVIGLVLMYFLRFVGV